MPAPAAVPNMQEIQMKVMGELMGPGGFFELGPITVRHGPTYKQGFVNGFQTLPQYYDTTFKRFPSGRDFLVFGDDRITYGQADATSRALGASLEAQFGIRAGDRVAISMRNYPEWCLAYIAITRMGAVAVPLNSLWKDSEYEYGLRDSGTKVLFCDDDRYTMAKAACEKLGVRAVLVRSKHAAAEKAQSDGAGGSARSTLPPGASTFESLVLDQAGSSSGLGSKVQADDMAGIMYTSGTTGNPKGVVQTHRSICQQMMMTDMARAVGEGVRKATRQAEDTQQPCIILPVPLFHVTASHHVFLASFASGRKIVMMYKWDPGTALKLIEREKATQWTGVPTMVQDLMEHPDFEKYDTSSLKSVGGGGGPTPKSQVAKTAMKFKGAGKVGTNQGYGLTETNGAVCQNAGENYMNKPTSIGPPFPIVEFSVREVENRDVVLPAGQRGELYIKSPLNMREYFNKPEKTAEVMTADGWFASGDIGMLDEEGFAYILDRAKDLIIRGGENISCAEVETAFFESGKVLECACFGIPDDRLGEIVGLMVVPSAAGAGITAKALRDAVVGKIANFKIPDVQFIFVTNDKLPRGATEKILKREIRDSMAIKLGRAKAKL